MKIAKFSSKLHYELYKLLQKELWATQKELQIKNKNNMYMIGEPLTKKEAEKVYRRFYELVPTRLMHIFLHRELAITLAIASVRDKIKTLEFIDSGMMSRTCVIGTDPTEVLVFWRDVEKWLLERQKEILKQNKD